MGEKKQVVFVHGGEAFDSREEFHSWLRKPDYDPFGFLDETEEGEIKRWHQVIREELGDEYEFIRINMPTKQNAKYEEWVIWLGHFFRHVKEDSILIGHSLGANFWVKYLSENKYPKQISQLHLVSGCFGWQGGFNLGDDLSLVEEQVSQIHIYQSHDDDMVDFNDALKFQGALPSATLHTFTDRGHFLQESFPELIENIKK